MEQVGELHEDQSKISRLERKGHTSELRKKDPLLSYLENARGADEHTIEAIVSYELGAITVMAPDQKTMDVELSAPYDKDTTVEAAASSATSLSVSTLLTRNPEPNAIAVNQQVIIGFKAARLKLAKITNRGRTYHPPTSHLSRPLSEIGPIEAAELGIRFYENYYRKAEEHLHG